MAKTAASAPETGATASRGNGAPVDVSVLKEEGSRAFAMKNYEKAVAAWDKALAQGPSTADTALLHNNKAACHMVGKRYKEAVAECSAALEAQPEYFKALTRRAKALEQLGQHKQALADLQRANKLEAATDDSREAERRVRDLVAGKKPAGMGNGLAVRKPSGGTTTAVKQAAAAAAANRPVSFPVKLTMGDDTRLFSLTLGVTYSELMEHVRSLFPAAGPLVLKFADKEGDLVTIASRNDIQRAIQEAYEAAGKTANVRLQQGTLPPIRMQAVKVASDAEVPKIPDDEAAYMQHMMEQLQRVHAAQAASKAAAAAAQEPAQPQQVQVDEWILAFVDLLKEHCGVDPDKPLEAQEVGNEKLTAAFQAMMHSDPKADGLLDQAYDKFEEQAAVAMVTQAQVHEARATILVYKAAAEGAHASTIADAVEAHLNKAEERVAAAHAFRPSPIVLEGLVMQSGIHQLRAKLAANYLVGTAKPREDIDDTAERQKAEEAAGKELTAKALKGVTAESAAAADSHMEAAYATIRSAMEGLSEEEKAKELKPMKPMAEQVAGEEETPLRATLLINLGNAHYEHSVLRSAGGLEWRSLVEKAQALFREAGAAEVDIRNALLGHPTADEMADIVGPEPKPEAAAEAAPAAAEPAAEEAPKGLPALGPKPKKNA